MDAWTAQVRPGCAEVSMIRYIDTTTNRRRQCIRIRYSEISRQVSRDDSLRLRRHGCLPRSADRTKLQSLTVWENDSFSSNLKYQKLHLMVAVQWRSVSSS